LRKDYIKEELHSAAERAGYLLNEYDNLLDIVTFLVEDPYVVMCEFDKNFLDIPDIVLIAEMKEHQKYFPLVDQKGRVRNKFLVVSNNPQTDYIKSGNEKVITARFNDARFFYNEDSKVRLDERVEALKNVIFHKDLGSIYDKVERMGLIAERMCVQLGLKDDKTKKIKRAVYLCKTDLITSMVIEFPSLQGRIGRIYALNDGEEESVAEAIENHYKPRLQGDELPSDIISIAVSISEKIDNIFGSFSVGNIPKGSYDPYALRRQANAVVEMLIKNEISISIKDLLSEISENYNNGIELVDQIIAFISARAKTILIEKGLKYDEIDACLSVVSTDYLEISKRAKSLNEFRSNKNFSEMLLSFKRMNNIITAFRNKNNEYKLEFDESLLETEIEKELFNFFNSREEEISGFIESGKYLELFKLLIQGKLIIDNFFDNVLVMDDRIKVRDNRLSLLEDILKNFSQLFDFSRIADK